MKFELLPKGTQALAPYPVLSVTIARPEAGGHRAVNHKVQGQEALRCQETEGVVSLWGRYLPVIVHNGDEQADLVHVLWRDVKDDGLVVDRIESVLLYGGFLLLQPPPVTKQGHFDVRICADRAVERKGRQRVKQMSSTTICTRGTEARLHLLLVSRCPQWVVKTKHQ